MAVLGTARDDRPLEPGRLSHDGLGTHILVDSSGRTCLTVDRREFLRRGRREVVACLGARELRVLRPDEGWLSWNPPGDYRGLASQAFLDGEELWWDFSASAIEVGSLRWSVKRGALRSEVARSDGEGSVRFGWRSAQVLGTVFPVDLAPLVVMFLSPGFDLVRPWLFPALTFAMPWLDPRPLGFRQPPRRGVWFWDGP